MPSFGDRLREVRGNLKFSQQEMANRCGISLRSQRNYEKGVRSPDSEYMVALSGQGIDVSYLLTGLSVEDEAKQIEANALASAGAQLHTERVMARLGINAAAPKAEVEDRLNKIMEKFIQLDEHGMAAVESMINALLTKK